MHGQFCATTGTVYEIMFENASDFYGYFLSGTNRCAEIWMCFSCAFSNRHNKNASHKLSHQWYMPARVPINWRGGAQACLLE